MKKILLFAAFFCFLFSSPLFAAPILMGSYANWSVYDATHANPYPGNAQKTANPDLLDKLEKMNTVTYAFLEVDSQGSVYFSDPWSDLAPSDVDWCNSHQAICWKIGEGQYGFGNFDAFADPNNVKNIQNRIMSIGGYGHMQEWKYAISEPVVFAKSVVDIAQHFHVNGIDLDAEPINSLDIPGFINLVKVLRQTLDQNGLKDFLITFPVSVNQNDIQAFGESNWQQLLPYINYVGVMGYDMHGEFDVPPVTNLQSQLYVVPSDVSGFSTDTGIRALETVGVPASKIILGIPAYARGVSEVQGDGLGQTFGASYQGDLDAAGCTVALGQNTCGGMQSYRALTKAGLVDQAKEVQVSNVLAGAYVNDALKDFFSFDDAKTVAAKANYVNQNDLAGMLIWTLNSDIAVHDQRSLIGAMVNNLK